MGELGTKYKVILCLTETMKISLGMKIIHCTQL